MVRAAGVPFLPVNSQRIDGDEFVNDHLSRAFQIRARVKASLLFEGFIVFNTTYATGMNTQAMPFFCPLSGRFHSSVPRHCHSFARH